MQQGEKNSLLDNVCLSVSDRRHIKKGAVDLDKSREVCSFRCANLKRTKMLLTKEQISEQMRKQMRKHAEEKNGLHDLMEIMLESMMVAERGEFLAEHPGNKGNGYRPGHSCGKGKKLEFRIPSGARDNKMMVMSQTGILSQQLRI
jgi:hypothetical protein